MVKHPARGASTFLKAAKVEPYLFYLLLAAWLIPVWSVDYFVTGDGPCHLYNSNILAGWWHADARMFYQPFYHLNTHFEPNWIFNAITAPVLALWGPFFAEKTFFTIYVVVFGLGFRYLITRINPAARFISHIGLLFMYNRLLMAGFLNNAFSLALWCWVAGFWWSHRDDIRPVNTLRMTVLFLLVYAAHPMGFTYSGMTVATMMLGLTWHESRSEGWGKALEKLKNRIIHLFLSVLPSLFLFLKFLFRHTWTADDKPVNQLTTWEGIGRLSSLQSLEVSEKDWTTATAIVCIFLFISAIVLRLRGRKWMAADGLLLLFAFVVYTIFRPPGSISGGLEIPLRIGMVLYPVMLFWAATAVFPDWIKTVVPLAGVIITAVFLAIRLPIHQKASDYATEIRSCAPYIADRSTLLTLNYDWAGRTPDGQPINKGTWLFPHIDCYLGTDRRLVISDNYETHFSYFPVIVNWETDMYTQTDKDGINFDNRPPRADLLHYQARTGQSLDYVLMCGYNDSFADHAYTREIKEQLEQAYEQVFATAGGRAVLYRKKQ